MSKLLVVGGHTDPQSFTHALALRYEREAARAGVDTDILELAQLQFDLVLRSGREPQALEPDLQRARDAIERADHVAWFFPTWWAAPPALVKGFIERVLLPGFAYRYEPGRALQHKLLRGRSARLVTTMDAPWWWYALFYRSALHRSFVQATLRFCGFAPVSCSTFYGLRNKSPAQRGASLLSIGRAGDADARSLQKLARRALPQEAQAPEGKSRSSATPSTMR